MSARWRGARVQPDGVQRARAGFQLTRYFTVASLILFTVVGVALYFLEGSERKFLERVQHEQSTFMSRVQAELARQQSSFAINNLLAVHEAAHVTLTHVLANLLWETHLAPFVTRAEQLPVDGCRKLATAQDSSAEAAACFAELGRKIMAFPGFDAINSDVHAAMKRSTVFKIKVYDVRGITVYSSELQQIGEDKSDNLGWQIALGGRPASELTHRDRFSAFEGTVENRDLISSYVPVFAGSSGKVSGVFEIYSDATPFLEQIKAASGTIGNITAANEAEVARIAKENQRKFDASSNRLLLIIGALLALLFAALLLIVRNAQRIIDSQVRAQEQAALREQLWHREKMAALAAMAANVSHEVGNPLAVISGLAQEMAGQSGASGAPAKAILEQTSRIARMTRQITEFARARRETPELVDVSQMVKAVCEFLAFDVRYRGIRFDVRAAEQLPACMVIPDYLNQALMAVLQRCAEMRASESASPGLVAVETQAREGQVVIRLTCASVSGADPRSIPAPELDTLMESAQRRLEAMGGELRVTGESIELVLPAHS